MLSLHDVSAWVEVDGKKLEPYGVEEDLHHGRVTCWIAAQAGKNFSVNFKDGADSRLHSLGSHLELDGSSVAGRVLYPSTPVANFPAFVSENRTMAQNDQALTATFSRPFLFSRLELTDEDEYLHQDSVRLGEISIRIYRVESIECVPFQLGSIAHGHGKVHERSKKAVSHCVSYGQEVQTAMRYTCHVRYLDSNPFVTFVFKYRESSLLQANGIMPKPPPAKRVATPEDVLDLTVNNNVKPEHSGDEIKFIDGTTQKGVVGNVSKRQKISHDIKARPNKGIKEEAKFVSHREVIDLT